MTRLVRHSAAAMIAVMVAMAGANLLCALDCDHPAAAGAAHCHEATPTADLKFAASHDCASHQVQTAVSQGRVKVSVVLVADLVRSLIIELPVGRPIGAELRIRAAASPSGPTVVPLRI